MNKRIAGWLLGAALAALALAASAAGKTEVLWLGQSATRITSPEGKVILIDPFITGNPKTPPQWKNLDQLGRIDVILVTHAHADHLGDAPELARKLHVPLYGPSGLDDSLVQLGMLPRELAPRMNLGGTVTPVGDRIRITMVHAEHSSELTWRNPATGKDEIHVGGEPAGFIIRLENGFTIYHMGDTALFGDMRLIAERYHPDLILIPIGGHFTMDPQDAAFATKNWLKPRHAIPIHYGTTPLLAGTPAEYLDALGKSSVKVDVLQPGEAIDY